MKHLSLLFSFLVCFTISSQSEIEVIKEINLESIPSNQIKKYWLQLSEDGLSQPISIPVIIAKGNDNGPVLGLLAAIHGNELNGIKVLQEVFKNIDIQNLKGTIIAVPGLNQVSITQDRRRFFDEEDLNRHFPGKETGNRSQQYVWQINNKIISKIDYLIDMHTARYGRLNSL